MKTLNLITLVCIAVLMSACAGKPSVPSAMERDGVSAISNTADLQMTFIKDLADKDRYCGARASDVADTSSSGASIGGGTLGDTGNIGEGTSQGALSLGGRNPAVLIVREMMYRACELSMNLNTDTNTTIEIYTKFFNAIKDITSNQTGTGTASVGEKATSVMSIKDDTSTSSSDSKNDSKNGNNENNTDTTDINSDTNDNDDNNSNTTNSNNSTTNSDDGF